MSLDFSSLESLLLQMTVPDTSTIKSAENVLHSFLSGPACVGPLMAQLVGSTHPQARHLAAIYLRTKIGIWWKKKIEEGMKTEVEVDRVNCQSGESSIAAEVIGGT